MTQQFDVLIIGAGPAGTVAASILNKKGCTVRIIEATKFPRFVIGESLLPRCMDTLEEAGMLEDLKAQQFQEKFGAKFIHGEEVCDFNFSEQFTKGYNWTWQVTRADFDKTLADNVIKKGVPIDFETSVSNVVIEKDGVRTTAVSAAGTNEYYSRFILDCSGYGRVLPKMFDLDEPSRFPPRAAFFSHLKDPNRPDNIDGNRIQIIVVEDNVWIWIIPFSNGNTSIGVVGNIEFLGNEKTPEEKFHQLLQLHPMLSERFKNPVFAFEPKTLSGYACSVKKFHGDRFALAGNSTEFLDPIFSSGVTFAIESGGKAANLIARQLQNEEVNWDEEYVQYMKQGIDTFRTYVTAWYDGTLQKIFFAKEIDQGVKERICSVLAGYVWDRNNTFVTRHDRALKAVGAVIDLGIERPVKS